MQDGLSSHLVLSHHGKRSWKTKKIWTRSEWADSSVVKQNQMTLRGLMKKKITKQHFKDNQAWVTYLHPFTIVRSDDEPDFSVPIDQINSNSYDHGKLCEVVTTLPVDSSLPFSGLVCFDGALAIPRIKPFETEDLALAQFNRLLCALLLGGVLCEAVDRRDIVWGELHKRRCIWPVNPGESLNSHIHCQLRMRMASSFDSIRLSNPNNISISTFLAAFRQGVSVLESLGGFTPTFLLRGFTALRYHNWSDALANLWICVEQLTSTLWTKRFIKDSSLHPLNVKRRLDSLANDSRTWSTSVRQEILWQIKAIDEQSFTSLFPARKARNELVHEGTSPDPKTVLSLYNTVVSLIEMVSGVESLGINELMLRQERPHNQLPTGNFDDWKQLASDVEARQCAKNELC